MLKRSPRSKKLYRWRITRIRSRALLIGYVDAPDPDTAIQAAIKEFGITDPDHQRRLAAQRTE
jgi:hypothetical protein